MGVELAHVRKLYMTHCLINNHIPGHIVFVLVSRKQIMMCPAKDKHVSIQ
jgi:hypothetical protein